MEDRTNPGSRRVTPKFYYYLDNDKNVVEFAGTYEELEKLWEGPTRCIRQEKLPGGYWLSTVFLVIPHGNYGDSPPDFFETMLFDKESANSWETLWCERYTTFNEAVIGHIRIKQKFMSGKLKLYSDQRPVFDWRSKQFILQRIRNKIQQTWDTTYSQLIQVQMKRLRNFVDQHLIR